MISCPNFLEAGTDGLIFSGYAAVWNEPDENGEIIRPGAFAKSLTVKSPKLLYEHAAENIIGRWLEIYEDDYGLFCRGEVLPETVYGQHAAKLLETGVIDGLSIGYIAERESAVASGRAIDEADLWEVSLVVFPAQRAARLSCPIPDAVSFMTRASAIFAGG